MASSLACMAAIVAILVTTKDRPLSEWDFYFSIPATLAFLGLIAKSTAAIGVGACISQYKWLYFKRKPRKLTDLDLLEEASRGPLGSLILLARRPMGLASIGAIVTLLAMAVEVFVQQMVQFNPRDVVFDDGKAVLGLAHTYNGGARPIGVVTTIDSLRASTADRSMQGAVYRGLFNLDSPSVFDCASKCQWTGTYVSLGFTSTCADVTDATLRSHTNASATWNGTSSGRQEDMNLITPGGVNLEAVYSATSWQTVVSVGGLSRISSDQVSNASGDEPVLMPPDIARIAVFRTPVDATDWIIWADKMEIVECDVEVAAYRYSNLSSSGSELTIGDVEMVRLDPGTVTIDGIHADMLMFDQPGLPVLQARLPDIAALAQLYASTRFIGSIYDGETPPLPPGGLGDAFRSGNISRTMQDMANSMTDQLRASREVKGDGQSIRQVVFVEVEWGWIILPIAVQVISAAFLLLILVQSARTKDLPLWKSSTTALLTYDVRFSEDENGVGNLGTGVKSLKELDALGESVKARLELAQHGSSTATAPDDSGSPSIKGLEAHVYPVNTR
ncbi:uncharacterized protein B0H64DRAFT_316859 [Chaetomium fimeti]|uniref:Uncharacterized protein n=1 Tax=Chaetomium fimeti TaxID=1854472 RepID=A0AAE0LVK7_9PEZI|nr:hypothetical protein B0H64DRAFT_316859 [Chaetomium fimeti]